MAALTSLDRMLRTLDRQPADHVPCCFMSFTLLREKLDDDLYRLCKNELEMGLNSMLFIPSTPRRFRYEHPDLRGLAVRFDPRVKTTEWRDGGANDYPILHKVYETPGGRLSTSIRLTEDWRTGDRIPFVDDYQISRAVKPLVTEPAELEALQYMLTPPTMEDAAFFEDEVRRARSFVDEYKVMLVGGWGVGMDLANWLCGTQPLILHTMDQPTFVNDMLEMIHLWNLKRMEVVLSAPIDLFIRRAWYEGCDFVTPEFYRQSILPRLKVEVDLAHQHGVRFGYICTSGIQPMADMFLEAGIDVLIGIDPVQGSYTDLPTLKKGFGARRCLWGGLSGAITVERGDEVDVRAAVKQAMQTLGPESLILSPVDNITVELPRTWRNVDVLIDEWRHHWPTEIE